ncbi:outer membrane heme receptor [Bordetella pertussis]|nr:outer membrane heme receptor [Bordetella pertussis]
MRTGRYAGGRSRRRAADGGARIGGRARLAHRRRPPGRGPGALCRPGRHYPAVRPRRGARRASAGLQGVYSVPDGLARLLDGSGLDARQRGAGTYVLQALPAGPVAQLAPVTIEADGVRADPAWAAPPRAASSTRASARLERYRQARRSRRQLQPPHQEHQHPRPGRKPRGHAHRRHPPALARRRRARHPGRAERGGLHTLSRLDVVRGADSSAAGSGALGGLADLRTLEPADLLRDGRRFGALAKSDYDSADASWGLNAALAGQVHDDTSWLLQAGTRNGTTWTTAPTTGGYGSKRSQPSPEDYAQNNFLLKLQQRIDGGHRLGLTGEYFKRRADLDQMYQQGAGTSYQYGANRTHEETTRKRVSLDYQYNAPQAGAAIDSARAMVYWQRLRLDSSQDAPPHARRARLRPPRRPVLLRLPQRPLRAQQLDPGIDPRRQRRALQPLRRHGVAARDDRRRMVRQPHRAVLGRLRQLPRHPARHARADGAAPVRHAAYQPGRHAPGQGQPVGHLGAGRNRLRRRALHPDPVTALRPLRAEAAARRRLPEQPQRRRAAAVVVGGPLLAQAAGHLEGARGADAVCAIRLRLPGAVGHRAVHQLRRPGNLSARGQSLLEARDQQGLGTGRRLGDDQLGGAVSLFDNRYQNFIDKNVPLGKGSPQWQPAWDGQYPLGVTGLANRARVRIYGAEASAHWRFAPNWRTWARWPGPWARTKTPAST